MSIRRLGLIVNPYAGIGGPLAQAGSDAAASSGSAQSVRVCERVRRVLEVLAERREQLPGGIEVVAGPGAMGADAARRAGLTVRELLPPLAGRRSTASDTRTCAMRAQTKRVDLLLFAGGDGTARDVTEVIAETPILGIPCGVKMHSGVFAANPRQAAEITLDFLSAPESASLIRTEIVDGDETARREGRISTRIFGSALVPNAPGRRLPAKAGVVHNDDRRLAAACAAVASELGGDELWLVGPGTTTAQVLQARGIQGSLLGVDAVRGGKLIGRDLDENALLGLLEDETPRLLLGVIGGQGMLLGRGNQQLSPAVLRRIDRDRITVLAARDKLLALDASRLHVDTGDTDLDMQLAGWLPVQVGPAERLMMEVAA